MTAFGLDSLGPTNVRALGSYANPNLTIALRDIPTNLKQIMRLCRFYYNTDALMHALVDKMAEYPVTRIRIKELPGHRLTEIMRRKWEELLNVTMNVRRMLIEMNTNETIYGADFRYLYFPFIRYCKCSLCGSETPITAFRDGHIRMTTRSLGSDNFQMEGTGTCPHCKSAASFSMRDVASQRRGGVRLIPVSPLRVNLNYNPSSGERRWFWKPPGSISKGLSTNDRVIIDSTEAVVLQAAMSDRLIHMDQSRLWVSLSPGQPDLWEGWGVPPLYSVLEDVYYYKILRRANEALAQEHVTPTRILSPSAAGNIPPPQGSMNLSDWQVRFRNELMTAKHDPNHIILSPISLNVEQIGGQARVMMVSAEMEAAARGVATGVGCPLEMLWGGLNWTGASLTLRMLENHFLNTRENNNRFLAWMAPHLASNCDLTPVELELSEFKMADDAQHISNSINLMLQGYQIGRAHV